MVKLSSKMEIRPCEKLTVFSDELLKAFFGIGNVKFEPRHLAEKVITDENSFGTGKNADENVFRNVFTSCSLFLLFLVCVFSQFFESLSFLLTNCLLYSWSVCENFFGIKILSTMIWFLYMIDCKNYKRIKRYGIKKLVRVLLESDSFTDDNTEGTVQKRSAVKVSGLDGFLCRLTLMKNASWPFGVFIVLGYEKIVGFCFDLNVCRSIMCLFFPRLHNIVLLSVFCIRFFVDFCLR